MVEKSIDEGSEDGIERTESKTLSLKQTISNWKYIFISLVLSLNISSPAISQEKASPNVLFVNAAVHRNFPPAYSVDKNGRPTGFAVELTEKIAPLAGLKVAYIVKNSWAEVNEALKKGGADFIPDMGVIKERKAVYDFTAPFRTFSVSIFVRKQTYDIRTIDDLMGRKVGVVRTNAGEKILKEHKGIDLRIYSNVSDIVFELLSGHVDAVVYPESVLTKLAWEAGVDHRIKVAGKPLTEVKRAMAVSKGNTELLKRLDDAVKSFIKTKEYQQLYTKWFGRPQPFWTVSRVIWAMSGLLLILIISMGTWRYFSVLRLNRELKNSINRIRQTEKTLKESEERFRAIFEQAAVGVAHIETKTGRFLRVNQKYCDIIGYKKEEMIETTFMETTHPDDLQADLDNMERLRKGEIREFSMEKRLFHKDGSVLWVNLTVSPMWDAGEEPNNHIAVVKNITVRKKAESALVTSEQRWKTTFDCIKDSICLLDIDGRILKYNNSTMAYTQKEENDILGRFCWEVFHGSQKPIDGCSFIIMKGSGQRETTVLKKDGRFLEFTVDPVVNEDGVFIGAVHIVSDITDRKRAEEKIKTSLKEKELLLKEIHHRVKNNMQVISSMLQLQSVSLDDEKTIDIFRRSQDRIKSMAIIHDMLYQAQDFSKIDFRDYIETLTETLFSSYKKETQDITLIIDVKDVFLNLDTAVPLGLIINELVTNSLKHGFKERDEGEISIALSHIDDDKIELNVRDNGIGLPEGFNIKEAESLGLEIVAVLSEKQLNGDLKIKRDSGTEFQIVFQKAKYNKRI